MPYLQMFLPDVSVAFFLASFLVATSFPVQIALLVLGVTIAVVEG